MLIKWDSHLYNSLPREVTEANPVATLNVGLGSFVTTNDIFSSRGWYCEGSNSVTFSVRWFAGTSGKWCPRRMKAGPGGSNFWWELCEKFFFRVSVPNHLIHAAVPVLCVKNQKSFLIRINWERQCPETDHVWSLGAILLLYWVPPVWQLLV